jgi:hypothetical protein
VQRQPNYCLYGNRHKGGMNPIQALMRNTGSLNGMQKGKPKQEMPARRLPMTVEVADEAVVVMKPL